MHKRLLVLVLLAMVVGCASTQPTVDYQNIFTYSHLNLRMSNDLRYMGVFDKNKHAEHKWDSGHAQWNDEFYVFNKPATAGMVSSNGPAGNHSEAMVVVVVSRIRSNSYWLSASFNKNYSIDQGTISLAGRHWRTAIQLISLTANQSDAVASMGIITAPKYITKTYVRNINNKTRMVVYYMEPISGYESEVKQYIRLGALSDKQAKLLNSFVQRAESRITFLP